MNIVLDEYKWAENAIREKSLNGKPFETLSRVAKYYTYKNLSSKQVRSMLDKFLLQCAPGVSLVSWSGLLDSAVKYASKNPIIMMDGIDIYASEMDAIDSLHGVQLQRLAFTLLCVAKYLYAVSPKTQYWVNTPDNEIMRMANLKLSLKKQGDAYSQLRDAGLIKFSKAIDNLSVQVLFAEQDGDNVLTVSDYRNLGYQYMMFHGGNFFICECCGLVEKNKGCGERGRPKKYCQTCAATISTRKNVNNVMCKYSPKN